MAGRHLCVGEDEDDGARFAARASQDAAQVLAPLHTCVALRDFHLKGGGCVRLVAVLVVVCVCAHVRMHMCGQGDVRNARLAILF